jgi:hypothetical protein
MKRLMLAVILLVAAGGLVAAETAGPGAKGAAAPSKSEMPPEHQCMMGGGMMGGGMMGGGMMGGGMGPMLMGPGTKVAVKNLDKGVTITLTATDAATVSRLQKMAEAMRLMHEAMTP